MQTVIIKVGGMSCEGCVKNVSGVLRALPGVESVEVSLAAQEARVRFDPARTAQASLCAAIEDAGFEALHAKIPV
ncbi:MAG: heavy-metal-associated domain-containing protein [Betaproteobacteria bacterium]|nr:heavy-metal-associated domain-containing protein [Betaproteobacteria bacterium]